MPIYEYRCRQCGGVNSVFLRSMSSPDPSNCGLCNSEGLERIISRVAYLRSEADKMEQLDPRYFKMVDQALANAPPDSDPGFHMNKMVPFSQARETGEPYFKE